MLRAMALACSVKAVAILPWMRGGNKIWSSSIVRRELWQRIGGYDMPIPYVHDYDFWVRCLKAENERLRKAGDAMHLAHEANFNGYPYTQNQVEKAMKAWRAAKGVKP